MLHDRASVSLTVSISPAVAQMLSALAKSLDAGRELVQRGLCTLDASGQVTGVDLDRLLTTRAVDGGVVLEPSDLLLELAAAAGAGQVQVGIVQKVHGGSRA